MENRVINKIINNKIPCIFVSPHLDDAVLSAGDLIQYLAKKTKVSVITVFTEASPKPYTRFAKKFSHLCGYNDAEEFFDARKQEDLDVFKGLDIKCHHLGFIDAAWRKKENPGHLTRLIGKSVPEFLHLYPIFQIHASSNRIHRKDEKIINTIAEKLLGIINTAGDYYIFCPLATNTHIDHVITREAVQRNFQNIIFWTDFPYSRFRNLGHNFENSGLKEVLRQEDNETAKRNMIMSYKSQVNSFKFFSPGGNMELTPEIYYAKEEYIPSYMEELKKPTVSVGIPAYNEEANIGHLLRSVLSQKEENFVLKEILVVTDGSTDRTNERVKEITDKRIKLITDRERKGQVHAQNRIFKEADTDVVVLFEADTLPCDSQHIAKLIEPILADPELELVQGNIRPVDPKQLAGKVMKLQQEVYHAAISREFAAWFCTGKGGRAFTKKIYKNLVWPPGVPEDTYALLWCKSRNIKTFFQKSAYCFYRPPENFSDFLKAQQKIRSGGKELKNHFPRHLVDSLLGLIGSRLKIKMFFQLLISNPLFLLYYIYLKIKLRLFLKDSRFTDFWRAGKTTKDLNSRIARESI